MSDVPTSVVVRALVLGVVVVGTAGFMTASKTVTVTVDGEAREVRTYSRTVADVLGDQQVVVGAHDVVIPALTAPVGEGGRIEVRRGRLVLLTIDGVLHPVWTTAQTVDELTATLGARFAAATLTASRSQRIPLTGLALSLTLPKQVTVVHDGTRTTYVSSAATVAAVLAESGVDVEGLDVASPDLETVVTAGMQIRVVRVDQHRSKVRQRIDYRTVHRSDSSLYRGVVKLVRPGRPGVRVTTYLVTTHDGKVAGRDRVAAHVVRRPTTRIVVHGTAARPTVTRSTGGGVDSLNWHALAMCESSGNPRSVGGGGRYFGLYQFTLGTWRSVGGSGNPIDASASEQTARAKALYRSRGSQPWPTCGRLLYT